LLTSNAATGSSCATFGTQLPTGLKLSFRRSEPVGEDALASKSLGLAVLQVSMLLLLSNNDIFLFLSRVIY
jgi:hypothetical protein